MKRFNEFLSEKFKFGDLDKVQSTADMKQAAHEHGYEYTPPGRIPDGSHTDRAATLTHKKSGEPVSLKDRGGRTRTLGGEKRSKSGKIEDNRTEANIFSAAIKGDKTVRRGKKKPLRTYAPHQREVVKKALDDDSKINKDDKERRRRVGVPGDPNRPGLSKPKMTSSERKAKSKEMRENNEWWLDAFRLDERAGGPASPVGRARADKQGEQNQKNAARNKSAGLIGTTERTPIERQAPKPEWDKGTGKGYPKPKPKPAARLRPDPGAKGVTPKPTPKSTPVAKPYQGGAAASKARPVGPTPNKPTPVNQVELNKKKIADKKKADTLSTAKTGSRLGGERKTISSTSRPANTMSRPQSRPTTTAAPKTTPAAAPKPTTSGKTYRQKMDKQNVKGAKLNNQLKQQRLDTNAERNAERQKKAAEGSAKDKMEKRKGGVGGGIKSALGGDVIGMRGKKGETAVEKDERQKMNRKSRADFSKKKVQQTGNLAKSAVKGVGGLAKASQEDRTQVAGPSGDVSGGSTYQSRSQRG